MKAFVLASVLLMSTNVFASKMVTIKTLTNQKLDSAAAEVAGLDLTTHYTFKKVTELKGKGKTAEEIRTNTIAQALHTVCPFFDDGVNISRDSKDEKGSLTATKTFIGDSSIDENDADFKGLLNAIRASNKEAAVEVYSGDTSGNNTVGTVLGFYDTKNNELAVFANTNCGTDN